MGCGAAACSPSLVEEVCGQFIDWLIAEYGEVAATHRRDEHDLGAKAKELRKLLDSLAPRPQWRARRIGEEFWRQRWMQYAPAHRMWAEKRLDRDIALQSELLVNAGRTIHRLECIINKRNRKIEGLRAALKKANDSAVAPGANGKPLK